MGVPMSEGDIAQHDPTLAKPKRKAKNISFKDPNHGIRFYPDLYVLAQLMWDLLSNHRIDFPQLPTGGTNKSTYLHDIGKIIAMHRKEYAIADVHGIGDLGEESIDDLIQKSDKPSVYMLRQSTILSRLREEYGPLPETKKPTIDDKVRVMGLTCSRTCGVRQGGGIVRLLMLHLGIKRLDFEPYIKISLTGKRWYKSPPCGFEAQQN